ncbi:cellulase family glycosylhydrolase [Bradyrhizobium prioriisuperbiae]|uniref:cellulase family glycosylhydrolase n=1 Tax=Bradyrhizobium prioriisuperbiae TaxID=2854389 RepID=UPI0028E2B7E0|nr:cellulase family glycosylhydrolase [Bradyrhizobium prioritasuperba]
MIGRDHATWFGKILLAAVVASGFATQGVHAQGAQPLESRLMLGVGTHQGMGGPTSKRGYVPATNIDQIRELGATSFRDDFSWSDFEQPGRRMGFAAPLSRLETQIKSDVAKPVLIFGAGHHLVPNSNPPTTDEARQRFVDYAVAAALSVSHRGPIFELWNEWNIAARKNPDFNAENYLALAQATYPAVKRVMPNAPFIVGAIGDDPDWRWTESLLNGGVLKYADGISIHLYNHCARPQRRTAAEIVERLTAFRHLAAKASGNPNFPIYLTETGWPTSTGKCGVNEQAEADNMAQLILWSSTAASWLKGIWLYELKDSGTNSGELEDNFGLYHFDNSPKPAVCAVRDSWAFIRSSVHAEMAKLSDGVTIIKSASTSGPQVAVWSEDATKRYEIRLKGGTPKVDFDTPCNRSPKPASGAWMTVSSTPLLLTSTDGSVIPDFEIRSAK